MRPRAGPRGLLARRERPGIQATGDPLPYLDPSSLPARGSHRFGGLGRSLNEGRGRPWRTTGKFQNPQGLEEVQPPNRAPEESPEAGPGARAVPCGPGITRPGSEAELGSFRRASALEEGPLAEEGAGREGN